MTVDFPGLLLAALLCAEVAAAGLAVRLVCGSFAACDPRKPATSSANGADGTRLSSGGGSSGTPQKRRAWLRAARCACSSPLVLLLTFALADELACFALHALLDGAPRPLAGWDRAGWHVSIALSLGWPAALAWATMVDKSASARRDGCGQSRVNRRLDPLLGAYLGALAGLAIVYPPSRAGLRWTLLAWELLMVAVAWLGLYRRRLTPWGPAEVCLVVLVSCETMIAIVGPFASDPFLRWWIARAFYLGAWGLVCGVLARAQTANKGI